MARLLIRQWRVSKGSPSGLHVWFDPKLETIKLFELDPLGVEGVCNSSEGDGPDEYDPSHIELNEALPQGELSF